MKDILFSDIYYVHELLKNKKISSSELTKYIIDHINSKDPLINACTTVCYEYAIEQAKECDQLIKNNLATPLTGIPVLIKDNICTKGIKTTCSSKILENFIPPYDATVVRKLKQAGAIIIGKTNMDEFAMGSSTENSAFFVTKNPWNLNYVPGGSSGGSASAIAAHLAYCALGSDTGGSIRQPASFCNVIGLKPTYGLVSRYGLVAFASSLDQIGPITKTVRDCALVLTFIAGHDPNDATSVINDNIYYVKYSNDRLKGIRIGVPKEYIGNGIQKEVQDRLIIALNQLTQLGAIIDFNLSLPNTKYALAAYYIIAPSEASANLARYDGFKYGYSYRDGTSIWEVMEKTKQFGFGPEVKRRIMLGTFALSSGYYDAYYLKALKIRTLIKMEFEEAFKRYDVIITPTSPTLPFKIGEKIDDPVQMYMSDVCTVPVNIAGLPAISIPVGFVNGLPVGMQIIGRHFDEQTILNVAAAYESTVDWNKHLPPILKN